MRPPTLNARAVERVARDVLASASVTVEHLPIGYGNENWRVADASGRRYILKIGPLESAAKWGATRTAYELAAAAGVPVPRLVHHGVRDDFVVRVFEWVEGRSPAEIANDPVRVTTLFSALGAAVAALHSIELETFSSRLDDSAPSFREWSNYVDYRLVHIRDRCIRNDALDPGTVDRCCAQIADLAAAVSEVSRPTLCHRDLHEANLLVDEHGALLAIIDWDAAEAWDTAGEWFKLDWMLFPAFPGGEAAFTRTYETIYPAPPQWERRKRLVDLMETLNTVANATREPWNAEFEARARAHLEELLDR